MGGHHVSWDQLINQLGHGSRAPRHRQSLLFPESQLFEQSLHSDQSPNLQSTGQPWALQTISWKNPIVEWSPGGVLTTEWIEEKNRCIGIGMCVYICVCVRVWYDTIRYDTIWYDMCVCVMYISRTTKFNDGYLTRNFKPRSSSAEPSHCLPPYSATITSERWR